MLGGNPAPGDVATNLLYTGEQWDSHAQQYHLRARYYNPLTGRFNRTDPYQGNHQDPQTLHKYLYCHANPINATDPTGKFMGSIGDLINGISIRVMLFGMEHGPKIAAGVWAVTKITTAMWLAALSVLLLQELGVLPPNEYIAEIASILGIVLIVELFVLSMLPANWRSGGGTSGRDGPKPRGVNDPRVRKAVDIGNQVHYDKTTDPSKYTHEGGPTQLQQTYNKDTEFQFARRGQGGPDVKWIGGKHPSTYPGSTWPSGVNQADFKPDTPTGNAFKLPSNTLRILYDPDTGQIKH